MKGVRTWVGSITALICFIGLIAGWALERDMRAKSGEYQLVKASTEGALFGDPYEKIGSPQIYVVFDQSAVIGADEENSRRLNEDVLKAKGIPPLQLKSVTFVVEMSRLGFGAGLVIGLLLAILPTRKAAAEKPTRFNA